MLAARRPFCRTHRRIVHRSHRAARPNSSKQADTTSFSQQRPGRGPYGDLAEGPPVRLLPPTWVMPKSTVLGVIGGKAAQRWNRETVDAESESGSRHCVAAKGTSGFRSIEWTSPMARPLPRVDSRCDVLDSVWPRRNLLKMYAPGDAGAARHVCTRAKHS
jgi:hypothetical protein